VGSRRLSGELRPWSGNIGKRLVRTPKTYIRDSGLIHALLDLANWHDLLGHPVAGQSWEGIVVENAIAAAGERRIPYYYRTEDGAEIDLLFERGGTVEIAIEIKRSTAPKSVQGIQVGMRSPATQRNLRRSWRRRNLGHGRRCDGYFPDRPDAATCGRLA
jgi:predicted AAA+ superfamily ATPase